MSNSMPSATAPGSGSQRFVQRMKGAFASNPVDGALVLASLLLILGFYFFYAPFYGGTESTFEWLWSAWNPENDYNHGKLAPVIMIVLLWLLRDKFLAVPKSMSRWGIPVLAGGLLCFLLAARMLQPRIAVGAFPLIMLGVILILWGKPTARLAAFPLLFLWLVIPIPSLQQATAFLQGFIANSVAVLVAVFGIQVQAMGADLYSEGANDFKFTVAGGCSGVRSLMAMSMLAALYVYFTQNRLWKQLFIFCGTLAFTLIGNVARVASIVLIAAMGFEDFATGLYHDYSVFIIFFPVALACMVGFAWLVNHDYSQYFRKKDPPVSTPRRDDDGGEPESLY